MRKRGTSKEGGGGWEGKEREGRREENNGYSGGDLATVSRDLTGTL